MFTRYTGTIPLEETSIDQIPLDEQRAFFAAKGWPYGEALPDGEEIPEWQDDELYAAWATAQVEFRIDAGL